MSSPLTIRPPRVAESDQDIVAEAKKRYTRAESWEAPSRALGLEDEKFGNGDSDNNYQWYDAIRADRDADNLPCLTVNKTRQHCLQIINDMRDHEDGVQVRPVGGGASFDAAQVQEGLVRHVEYISNAAQAYDTASWHQVFSGIGYWRIITDYADEDSFNQEIYIQRIPNPRCVYLDPDIKQYDGSDARWAIIFDDVPREEAIAQGLIDKDDAPPPTFGGNADAWNNAEHVRVAEYFRRSEKADELIELPPDVAMKIGASSIRKSELPRELRDAIPKDARRRKIVTPEIEWFKIVGDEVVDRKPWPGKYVPVVRLIGEETVINGVLDRKGHVRAMKDPQRMYNYNSSAAVQFGALQTKTPWITPLAAIDQLQVYWNSANTANLPYLPYNDRTPDGREIQAPHRVDPPVTAPVFLEGMKIAEHEMMLASGQYQAVFGAPGNETSGKAINARQRQGDNATGHYLQHRATAIRFTGKILIDLIPKIYDTETIKQIIARDGSRKSVQISPDAAAAHTPVGDPADKDTDDTAISAIFNPKIGKFDVMADVGPSYSTARQEAFNAFSQIIQHNPELVNVVGDLMFKAADFPMADEISERLRNMVPAQATGGPSKEMQQMQGHMEAVAKAGQAQMEQLHQALQDKTAEMAKLEAQLADAKAKAAQKTGDSELDWYKAETARMAAVGAIDPAAMKPVVRGLVSDALGTHIVPLMHAHAQADQAMMPVEPAEGAPSYGV